MSVVADVTVPADSFTLQHALTTEPEMIVEADRLASHSAEEVMPLLWASGGDFEVFQKAMQDDPTVNNVTVIEESADRVLYQVIWHDEFVDLINEMIDQHASIVEAKAHGEKWRLQLRFIEEDQVSTFRDHFTERGYSFQANKISFSTAPRQRTYGLTTEQRDTLVTAFQRGYFNVPRDFSLEDLAEVFDISSNAVSQRIRRGSANLIEHALIIGTDTARDDE
ncbi:helix-turn-helix domain-containing protein [Haladaptatus halobius]|uniref:helix-turn-helix domain-containing protein n=1 Tax=Haladaptatus halobius TaxID=2884875 RepID=UPI001D0A9A39|nr:helix-turn-helix domain-containing protein [Haladaptatus halobius]